AIQPLNDLALEERRVAERGLLNRLDGCLLLFAVAAIESNCSSASDHATPLTAPSLCFKKAKLPKAFLSDGFART
ncbi:MAG: hypothetical protein AAF967_10685, partial [Pseudomonadota bacterium]